MDKKTILKIVGVVGVIGGSIAFYLGGTSADTVVSMTGAVFALAAIVAGIFGFKK